MGVSGKVIFSFPLSEPFPMIVVTYLFSQGIANAGMIERLIEPVLIKVVHTPVQCIIAIFVTFYLTMYVIPQPLARLIIVATMYQCFLQKTNLPQRTKTTLMYGVFFIYAVVNMASKDADIIMNYTAASFCSVEVTGNMWLQYMFVPTLITSVLVGIMFCLIFRKDMIGLRLQIEQDVEEKQKSEKEDTENKLTEKQKTAFGIIGLTVLLWMTTGIHGINNTAVTISATILFFHIGVLGKKDWKAIDITTLVFLTAAFSIGGVMKSCGAADIVFGLLKGIFPARFSPWYLCIMVFVTMLIHMILGSNTTTLSVVVPGLMILCSSAIEPQLIVFITIISVSFHTILPFHSVPMMIGTSNDYFPASYVTKMGIPLTIFVYGVILLVYLPYWTMMGLV